MGSGELPKYARLEYERRWLIPADGPDLTNAPGRLIEDLYVDGTRLRLRRVRFDDGRVELKLCKKYPPRPGGLRPITNVYLDEAEYAALAGLPGRRLAKRRYSVPPIGVDIFQGALSGLKMCEAEASSAEALASIQPPPWAGAEVTDNLAFAGGALVRLSNAQLGELLFEIGSR